MMGTPFVHERRIPEALNNCAFISTESLAAERGSAFAWLMTLSMLGVGVGFDVRGAGKAHVYHPSIVMGEVAYVIPDSREGWARSMELLVDSYLVEDTAMVSFHYDKLRPQGRPIRGFGGEASGPAPLRELHEKVRLILDARVGGALTARDIADICNLIGKCVVAGNVRRSAEICLGEPDDLEFLNLKNYTINPERKEHGWASNNSVFGLVGMDYGPVAERAWANGEPGVFWLDNVRSFGRMNGVNDYQDHDAVGTNPCAEQPLHHKELCTLVEVFLPRIENKQEFRNVLKVAFRYAKSVTLASQWITDPVSRAVMLENSRIGLSLTGVAEFVDTHGL
ncbi:hypothetical protein LCGC14_3108150, partial [marine sediment metagenome]